MVINLIGECDKRPVLYTLMKICQSLGDVLLVTNSTRLARLSDTRETYGHYQNTMIAVTYDGIDDFFNDFMYDLRDYEYVIIDNLVSAEADLYVYVKGGIESETEKDMLEYIDEYEIIELYKGKFIDGKTMYNCEEFEAYRDMCPINNKLAEVVSNIFAKKIGKSPKHVLGIATKPVTAKTEGVRKMSAAGTKSKGVFKRGI